MKSDPTVALRDLALIDWLKSVGATHIIQFDGGGVGFLTPDGKTAFVVLVNKATDLVMP